MEHNNNSINKQIEIHVVSNSFHKVQQSMSVRLKVPVYVPLDATTTSEHPTQGLMLFIYSMAQSEHWIPTLNLKKRRYIANSFTYRRRNSRFYFTSILSALQQSSRGQTVPDRKYSDVTKKNSFHKVFAYYFVF